MKKMFVMACEHGMTNAHSISRGFDDWSLCSEGKTFHVNCTNCNGSGCMKCDDTGLSIHESLPDRWQWSILDGDWVLTYQP